MSNLCSGHRNYDKNCLLCNLKPADIFLGWESLIKEAKQKGIVSCNNCQFQFYLTTDLCPKCGSKYE